VNPPGDPVRTARGRTICQIGAAVALIGLLLPWVSLPTVSMTSVFSAALGQTEANGVEVLKMLGPESVMTLGTESGIAPQEAGRFSVPTGYHDYTFVLLYLLCPLFPLGISFYKSRRASTERNIAWGVVGAGAVACLAVLAACAESWSNFGHPHLGPAVLPIGSFGIRYGAVATLLGNILVVAGGSMMLSTALAKSGLHEAAGEAATMFGTLNRCDACGTRVPGPNSLTKVEGKGFVCDKCHANS